MGYAFLAVPAMACVTIRGTIAIMTRFVGRPTTSARLSMTVAVVIALTGAAGCSSDESSGSSTGSQPLVTTSAAAAETSAVSAPPVRTTSSTSVPTTAHSSPTSDQSAYCVQVARLSGERPASYVGSAEQRADTVALIDVAPEDLIAPLTTFSQFLGSGAITTADPNSNLVENWPPAVLDAIKKITSYNAASC